MILYVCDKCHTRYDRISCFYNLTIDYAGENKQNLPNDGKFLLCGKCSHELMHILREWNGRINNADENDGK